MTSGARVLALVLVSLASCSGEPSRPGARPAPTAPETSAETLPTESPVAPPTVQATPLVTPAGRRVTPRPAFTPTPQPAPGQGPALAGCPMFPVDNPWNADVSSLPVDSRSAAYVSSINASARYLHADFGANPEYGIPYVVVAPDQPRVPVRFVEYPDESDDGPYPMPPDAPIEAGSDHHALVMQRERCVLYELYHAERTADGWNAGSGAIFDLRSNRLRPDGWTSADAAGLPILPGLVRYDEVSAGEIRHALRFTVQRTQRGYIAPATHYASSSEDANLPPMGLRLRLKASYDVARFTGHARVVLDALKRYGMIVADNGSSWFITGATDARWDDDDLNQLKAVPGSEFEAVQTGTIHR